MARRRFFVEEVRRGEAELAGEQARHLSRVLRVETGQRFEISDNERVWLAEVAASRKDRVVFRVIEQLALNPPPVRLTLLVSLIKFDRLEMVFEKATELGAERMVPVIASRSEKGLDKAAAKRLKRWRRIVLEASQQSRRVRLPEMEPPVPFREAVAQASDHRYFLQESPGAAPLLQQLPQAVRRLASDSVSLLVGPEGGWTEQEREQAASTGWLPVSLGPQILRTETAAIAALAVLTSAWLADPEA